MEQEVSQIQKIELNDIHDVVTGQIPLPNTIHHVANGIDDNHADLLAYYAKKRIMRQSVYFDDRIASYEKTDKTWKRVPPWLFFLSIVFALTHFLYDIGEKAYAYIKPSEAATSVAGDGGSLSISLIFILLAASLPGHRNRRAHVPVRERVWA